MQNKPKKPHAKIAEIKRAANAGPAILQFCYRPFFLGAGLWGALAIPIWLLQFSYGQLELFPLDALLWHQHEMLFGFAGAAIAGFMLTTIPNWTARLPVSGWRLATFFTLWLFGRLVMTSPATLNLMLVSAIDLAFLSTLTYLIGREIFVGRNWRNLPMLFLIAFFTSGNWLVHAEIQGFMDTAELGIRISLFTLTMLVAVIGGRLIPSFTRNWLVKAGKAARPNPKGIIDTIAYASLAIFIITKIIAPDSVITAYLALISSGTHLIRLIGWKGWTVLPEPFMWAQHLGYTWVIISLCLIGFAGLTDGVPYSAALHALTTGAFGTMILAVMTRASYTFTGRELKASPAITLIFVCITLSATLRTLAPFTSDLEISLLWWSGGFWTLAYGLFVLLFIKILTQHNQNNRKAS
ncbi:MAG: NnrS family protein [Sneathiella sp.]|nr:NnrS family protein [Sneathiella sp.]